MATASALGGPSYLASCRMLYVWRLFGNQSGGRLSWRRAGERELVSERESPCRGERVGVGEQIKRRWRKEVNGVKKSEGERGGVGGVDSNNGARVRERGQGA